MGDWGSGIFDNDNAADLTVEVVNILLANLSTEFAELLPNTLAAAKIFLTLMENQIPIPCEIKIEKLQKMRARGLQLADEEPDVLSIHFKENYQNVFDGLIEFISRKK